MIYIASKTRHAKKWQRLRDEGVPICSTWIDEAGPGQTQSMRHLWLRIRDEIRDCSVLLLYANNQDFHPIDSVRKWAGSPLKGALVEAGMALAFDKRIIVALEGVTLDRNMRPIGSWVNHDRVWMYPSLKLAISIARGYCGDRRKEDNVQQEGSSETDGAPG